MIEGVCGHCGGSQLYQDNEDGDIFCLNCGWRKPPDEVSDLPKRTAGVDRIPIRPYRKGEGVRRDRSLRRRGT